MSTGKIIRSIDTPKSTVYKEIAVRYFGDWQEYQVQPVLRNTGKVQYSSVYYTDDKQDAIDTMNQMAHQHQLEEL